MSVKYSQAADLEPIEKASRDELQALQLTRLKRTLHHVYANVDHYRQSFDTAGVHPNDLHELSDLQRFPFTTKKNLRDNYPFGLFAVPRSQVSRIHASSGTTGKPTVVGYTATDIDTWANLVARSIRAAGGRPGDMVHISYGYGLFTGGLGAHYGAERAGCTVIPMSGGQTEKQVQLLCDFKPDIIMVTPSYMLNIIDEFTRQGRDARLSSLKIGIFGAEPWTNAMRDELETRAGIDAVDIYGLSEVMGPGVASECIETKDGPVIWEDHFFPEIIHPITGEVLPDGSEGELVFTSLTKEALPVIRYRTRDLTRLLPPTARSMRRMDKITGRSDDMLIIRGVNVFPTQIEEIMLRCPELSAHYLIEVSREGNLDQISVTVEIKPEAQSQLSSERRTEIMKRLQQQVKTNVGISIALRLADHMTLVRSTGKTCHVIDFRKEPTLRNPEKRKS
jgi:phenylacetate-CoA ligase